MKKPIYLFFLSLNLLFAHDLWLEKSPQTYKLLYGHLHPNSEHKGAKIIAYEPKKIEKVICSKEGTVSELSIEKLYPLVIKEECDELMVTLSNGYFSKTPYGTKSLPKDEVKNSLKSWQSFESVKYFSTNSKTLLSDGLEIILLNTPKEVGDKARLQIFFQSRPIEGVSVAYDGKVRGKSSEEGKINIRLKRAGLQNIQATLKQKSESKKCDEVIYTTTLNLEVVE